MKRICSLVLIATIVSCNGSGGKKTDWHKNNLKGQVKSITEVAVDYQSETYFSENGFIDSVRMIYPLYTMSSAYSRDEEGWELERRSYRNDSLTTTMRYVYNGDRSKVEIYDENDEAIKHEVDLNAFGEPVYELYTNSDAMEPYNKREGFYTYNGDGMLIERKSVMGEGAKQTTFKASYEYNQNRDQKVMSFTSSSSYGSNKDVKNYENYVYDDQGNWIEREVLRDKSPHGTKISRTIKYYE